MVKRASARPGQAIVVTGTIGDAALGLALRTTPGRPGFAGLDDAARAHLLDRYLHPRPRLALAGALRGHARAAMDVSDGLIGDLAKMLAASGIGGDLTVADVPLSPAARAAIAAGADGLLVEFHPDPAAALSDGEQALPLETLPRFYDEVGRIAGALGRGLGRRTPL